MDVVEDLLLLSLYLLSFLCLDIKLTLSRPVANLAELHLLFDLSDIFPFLKD